MSNLLKVLVIPLALSFLPAEAQAQKINDKELREAAKQQLGSLPKKMPEPADNKGTPEKIALGKMLFFEPRLSLSHGISCNSCHNLAAGGSDNLPTSIGHQALRGGRNANTVLNAGFQFVQFWDGRAATLEEQAAGPITNPVEMAMPASPEGAEAIAVLRSIPEYEERFAKVFKGDKQPITMRNITRAIAAFERTLVSRGRFDAYLEGDNKALTAEEKRGLQTFLDTGCTACHAGPALGGQMYQKVGLVKEWPGLQDKGRFLITGDEADLYHFKVPMLRDIARTSPYFHNGSVWTLEEAIRMMAEYQLGVELKATDVASIAAFLQSLNGKPIAVTLPVLPVSTEKTPKPLVPGPLAPEKN